MDEGGNINQTMIINFIPTRPVEEIVRECVEAFCILFEPKQYLERAYRCFMMLGTPNVSRPFKMPKWVDLRAFLIILWRQGIRRKTPLEILAPLVSYSHPQSGGLGALCGCLRSQ